MDTPLLEVRDLHASQIQGFSSWKTSRPSTNWRSSGKPVRNGTSVEPGFANIVVSPRRRNASDSRLRIAGSPVSIQEYEACLSGGLIKHESWLFHILPCSGCLSRFHFLWKFRKLKLEMVKKSEAKTVSSGP